MMDVATFLIVFHLVKQLSVETAPIHFGCDVTCSSSEYDVEGRCCPLRYPGPGLKVKSPCSQTSNAVCEPSEGFYCVDPTENGCFKTQKHSSCKPGQYVVHTGTSSTDTVCADCTGETYSDGTFTTCQPHTHCKTTRPDLIKPGNHSHDSTCGGLNTKTITFGFVVGVVSAVVGGVIVTVIVHGFGIDGIVVHGETLACNVVCNVVIKVVSLLYFCVVVLGVYSPLVGTGSSVVVVGVVSAVVGGIISTVIFHGFGIVGIVVHGSTFVFNALFFVLNMVISLFCNDVVFCVGWNVALSVMLRLITINNPPFLDEYCRHCIGAVIFGVLVCLVTDNVLVGGGFGGLGGIPGYFACFGGCLVGAGVALLFGLHNEDEGVFRYYPSCVAIAVRVAAGVAAFVVIGVTVGVCFLGVFVDVDFAATDSNIAMCIISWIVIVPVGTYILNDIDDNVSIFCFVIGGMFFGLGSCFISGVFVGGLVIVVSGIGIGVGVMILLWIKIYFLDGWCRQRQRERKATRRNEMQECGLADTNSGLEYTARRRNVKQKGTLDVTTCFEDTKIIRRSYPTSPHHNLNEDHLVTESLSSPHPSVELQDETDLSSSFSGCRMGKFTSLPRSRSLPSLRQIPCTENKRSFRAKWSHSLNDVTLLDKTQKITPDIIVVENKESYRFHCTQAGLFQCNVTGLVFKTETEGDVTYRTVPWGRRLLAQLGKRPAGPLFDIKCTQGSVCQLHFPHCEILSMGGGKSLSVVRVMHDDGIELIKPHVITETHVIINITRFSLFGLITGVNELVNLFLNNLSLAPNPIHAQVLLFYTPPIDDDEPSSIMHVLLLPRNVVLREVLQERRNNHGERIYIEMPPCELNAKREYSLSTSTQNESIIILPKKARFEVDKSSYHNYNATFVMNLEERFKNVKMLLKDDTTCPWEGYVNLSAPALRKQQLQRTLSCTAEERLFDVRSSFINRVSLPNLNCLLDKLIQKKVLNKEEYDKAHVEQVTNEKARFVIDTVMRKGSAASSLMISFLSETDPFLSEHLGLM